MWKTEQLKTLVHDRLEAAAEEIFSLFEMTIRQYEEEVRRPETEHQQTRSAWTATVQPFVPAEDDPAAQDHRGETKLDQCEDDQELTHIKEEEGEEDSELCDSQTSENQREVDFKDLMFNIVSVQSADKLETPSAHQSETVEDCWASCSSQPVKEDCGAPRPSDRGQICGVGDEGDDERRGSGGQDWKTKETRDGGETADRPYTCGACNKTFRLKSILTRHMKTHTGDKPYSCVVCGKSFIQRSYLQTHMNSHSGQKPHTCSFCGRGFTQVGNMNAHIRIHTGEKPHTCVECGKSFREKADLTKHAIIHTGEKPYSCTLCNMKFSAQSNLTRHMKSHSGERPYSCTDCGKKFFRRSHLIIHAKTHPGDKEQEKDDR